MTKAIQVLDVNLAQGQSLKVRISAQEDGGGKMMVLKNADVTWVIPTDI